jgi:hypothetical protein
MYTHRDDATTAIHKNKNSNKERMTLTQHCDTHVTCCTHPIYSNSYLNNAGNSDFCSSSWLQENCICFVVRDHDRIAPADGSFVDNTRWNRLAAVQFLVVIQNVAVHSSPISRYDLYRCHRCHFNCRHFNSIGSRNRNRKAILLFFLQ